MIILSTYHFKEIEIFFEHFYDQHLISKISTCSLNKTNIINTIYIYVMLIFLLWNMCCCDFLCTSKKKSRCGILFHSMWAHSKNGNFGLIQPYQVNGVTLFWYTYIVGFFFLKMNSMINILELSISKYLCTSFIVERLSY